MYKRSASDFFRGEIFIVASRYSTGTYNYEDFYRDYMCSKNTFYTILKWAVEKCIVPLDIVVAMKNTSVNNSYKKTGISRYVLEEKTFRTYQSRLNKSTKFELSKEESFLLVVTYSRSSLSKSDFCRRHFCTCALLDRTIINCIIYSWIDDTTVETLRRKAYKFNNADDVDTLFDKLLKSREEFKLSKNNQ